MEEQIEVRNLTPMMMVRTECDDDEVFFHIHAMLPICLCDTHQ